jgi:predicted dehydrogenase
VRRDVDVGALVASGAGMDGLVEHVALSAPEGEPLRLEFESFLAAVRGEAPVVVTGTDGRDALAVALTIVREIERTLPALAGDLAAATGA